MTTEVPVVDLTPFYEGGDDGTIAVAKELDEACREIGFLGIVGHRVDGALVERTRTSVRGFFELPLEDKLASKPPTSNGRGYVPVEGETLSSTTSFVAAPDYKESFSIGPFDVGTDPYYRFEPSGVAFAPNVWPPQPADLAADLRAYYRALDALAGDLMTLTALAFSLPADFFAARNSRPTSALRILHYPPRPTLGAGQYPASPHTDYGTWTILKKRPGLTGLQAESVSGEWVDVVAPAEGFVVNVGDLLMRWTGGHWLSTLHRVMPVETAEPGGEISLVFFHQPNWDTVVYPFTADVVWRDAVAGRYAADAAEQHYGGIMAGEFVFGKYRASVSEKALAWPAGGGGDGGEGGGGAGGEGSTGGEGSAGGDVSAGST
ncbi:MAG TPA: 2-oxoglutarate and iron-dependent oxygenase domain-containing protein [Acidimicrobiales bacterium]|nr:2-oxoglutarate and iron-dependent oxygenase domain-containing protein [Acidimicrobiales bacterium]